ncbi:MAG: SCO family protein [Myxococcales bacterium]
MRRWRAVAVMAAMMGTLLASGQSRAEEALPPELKDIAIEEKPGAELPREIVLKDGAGRAVTLGDYFSDGKPVVLVLAYFRCPMLCSLVVNGLTNGLKDLSWSAGKDYRVLVVSFDPRDTTEVAQQKQKNYLKEYGRPVPEKGFEFLTGDAASVKRLADAVGFHYRWDEQQKEYAHAAGAFVVTPGGKLSRTLYGISFPEKSLRLALTEASEGRLGSAWDKVVLFCFHYDANARGYVLAATRLMKAGGALSVLLLGLFLWRLNRSPQASDRDRDRPVRPGADDGRVSAHERAG